MKLLSTLALLLVGLAIPKLVDVAHALLAVGMQAALAGSDAEAKRLWMWPFELMRYGAVATLVAFVATLVVTRLASSRRIAFMLLSVPWLLGSVYFGSQLYGGLRGYTASLGFGEMLGIVSVPVGSAIALFVFATRDQMPTETRSAA